jgi:hypothetical protein
LGDAPKHSFEEGCILLLRASEGQSDYGTKVRHVKYWRTVFGGRAICSYKRRFRKPYRRNTIMPSQAKEADGRNVKPVSLDGETDHKPGGLDRMDRKKAEKVDVARKHG